MRALGSPLVLMSIGLVAAFYVAVLASERVSDSSAFWLEAGKAAMSALAVGYFSVVIGFFVKDRDARRDSGRRIPRVTSAW